MDLVVTASRFEYGAIFTSRPRRYASPAEKSMLVAARKHATAREILLWMIPSEPPKALQASECSELLDPMRVDSETSTQH